MRGSFALAVALAVASPGCETFTPTVCDRSAEANPPVRYSQGTTENGVYMTSDWSGELLYFPGGMHYALEHGLGAKPRWIQSYLSFDQYGTSDGGMLAQASGNQVVVLDANAATITLANDTCSDYWLLVAAGTGAEPPPP